MHDNLMLKHLQARLACLQHYIERLEREKRQVEDQILCSLFRYPAGLNNECAERPDAEPAITSAHAD